MAKVQLKKREFTSSEGLAEAERRIAECFETKTIELELSYLGLTHLPNSVRKLTWLQELRISDNKLRYLPQWIGELTQLRKFFLYGNYIKKLPASLGHINQLESLFFAGGVPELADDVIGLMTNLSVLSLQNLKLKEVPAWVHNLKNLKSLLIGGNNITELPNWIGELSNIEELFINNNYIKVLPSSLNELRKLRLLCVEENYDLNLPPELIKSNNARRILDYYFRNAQPLNEFKLILVGRGLVGKTSLVHRLTKGKFKKFDRTPGINITKWPRKIDGDGVHAHIWDFGGQEIMHGTHRFFMTERALYLVLISGREGTEDYDSEYWLSMVRSFAGDVPIIVLLNKWDDYSFELNREQLKQKFGKDIVFIETDSATGTGIKELCDQICAHAQKLPGLKASWPVEWRQIKDELPAQKRSWLTFGDFRAFCHDHGITTAKDQDDLAESLHDLGLMLSYRHDEALRSFGVLNPVWVTDGIYKLLNSRQLRDTGGKFSVASFAEILPIEEYPVKLHSYLLALMRKFNLCHPLDDKGVQYLIPELLSKNEPSLEADFPPDKCLGFIYSYDTVLPEGLLPRFIVETYVHQEPKRAWRTGVVLERGNCRAFVRGDILGRKIAIWVAGLSSGGRRELLGIIRQYFERIHRTYEKLQVTESVPIPGFPAAHVRHELLLKYERAERNTIAVEIGNDLMDFTVKELLDGVDIPGAPRKVSEGSRQEIFKYVSSRIAGNGPHSLFISYSHKDEVYRDELRGALTVYERKNELEVWDDTRIEPGQKWEVEILGKLESADIIVLLLSNDFIKSDYCMQKEMQWALARDAAGECAIVPIVVRNCRFDKLTVGKIQAILPDAKPIKNHRDRDAAWLEVTKQLDKVIARLKKG